MVRKIGRGLAVLVLWAGAALPAEAGIVTWWQTRSYQGPGCPPHTYSCLTYAVPSIWFYWSYHHGPPQYIYAKDFHPDIPLSHHPYLYPCRAVDPATFSAQTYLPPVGSPLAEMTSPAGTPPGPPAGPTPAQPSAPLTPPGSR